MKTLKNLIVLILVISLLSVAGYYGYRIYKDNDGDFNKIFDNLFNSGSGVYVSFYEEDGVTLIDRVEYSLKMSEPTAQEKEGYRFSKWSAPLDNVTEDISVTPIYVKVWTVTFYSESEIYTSQTVDEGACAVEPESPKKEDTLRYDYEFSKWLCEDDSEYDFGEIYADTSLKASFSENVIQYDYNVFVFECNEELNAFSLVEINGEVNENLVLPCEYNLLPVTEIADGVFSDYSTKINQLYIPETIKTIGDFGFEVGSISKITTSTDNVEPLKILLPDYSDIIFEDFVDNYVFLTSDPDKNISDDKELGLYLDYMVFNEITEDTVSYEDYQSDSINKAFGYMTFDSNFSCQYSISGTNLKIALAYNDYAVESAATENAYPQIKSDEYYYSGTESGRAEDYVLFIDKLTYSYSVSTSEQLFYVVSRGVRPVPEAGSKAEEIYNKARSIMREIVSDEMSDYQKILAIYDYLIDYVTYDKVLLDKAVSGEKNLNRYKGFYLDGVFDDQRAVCDGISKAFVLLSRIEGIKAIRVTGVKGGENHAWCKVYVSGLWYVVDVTSGNTIIGGREACSFRPFLISDEDYSEYYSATELTSPYDVTAFGKFDVYTLLKYKAILNTYDCLIDTNEELKLVIKYIYKLAEDENEKFCIEIEFSDDYVFINGSASESEKIAKEIQVAVNKSGCSNISFSDNYPTTLLITQ